MSKSQWDRGVKGTIHDHMGRHTEKMLSAVEEKSESCKIITLPKHKKSHARFLIWIAYYYNTESDAEGYYHHTCPIAECRRSFNTHGEMQHHVKDCANGQNKTYLCPMCNKSERIENYHGNECHQSPLFHKTRNSLRSIKHKLTPHFPSKPARHYPHNFAELGATSVSTWNTEWKPVSNDPCPWAEMSSERDIAELESPTSPNDRAVWPSSNTTVNDHIRGSDHPPHYLATQVTQQTRMTSHNYEEPQKLPNHFDPLEKDSRQQLGTAPMSLERCSTTTRPTNYSHTPQQPFQYAAGQRTSSQSAQNDYGLQTVSEIRDMRMPSTQTSTHPHNTSESMHHGYQFLPDYSSRQYHPMTQNSVSSIASSSVPNIQDHSSNVSSSNWTASSRNTSFSTDASHTLPAGDKTPKMIFGNEPLYEDPEDDAVVFNGTSKNFQSPDFENCSSELPPLAFHGGDMDLNQWASNYMAHLCLTGEPKTGKTQSPPQHHHHGNLDTKEYSAQAWPNGLQQSLHTLTGQSSGRIHSQAIASDTKVVAYSTPPKSQKRVNTRTKSISNTKTERKAIAKSPQKHRCGCGKLIDLTNIARHRRTCPEQGLPLNERKDHPCPFPGCTSRGFTRQDNIPAHLLKAHGIKDGQMILDLHGQGRGEEMKDGRDIEQWTRDVPWDEML